MERCNCNCRWDCTVVALILSTIVGVVAAFLQISGTITVTAAFLWVALGVAVVYLAALVAAYALGRCTQRPACACRVLTTLLVGILGTALLALVLLAVGIVATSVVSAVLVGLLLFFFTLTIATTACFVRCLADCGN